MLENVRKCETRSIYLLDDKCYASNVVSDWRLEMKSGLTVIITDVTYIEEIEESFLSVTQLENKGASVHIQKGKVEISADGKRVMTGKRIGNLYFIEVGNVRDQICASSGKMWHERLGHANCAKIAKVMKANDIEVSGSVGKCEICMQCKSKKQSLGGVTDKSNLGLFERLHIDYSGPHVNTPGGCRGYQLIVDAKSGFIKFDALRKRIDGPDRIIDFILKIDTQLGIKVKTIRTDNAAEYDSDHFREILDRHGIVHEKSAPYCQFMNGKAERTIQTMNNRIRCALQQGGAKTGFWAEAGSYMAIVENFLMDEGPDKEKCEKLLVSSNLASKLKVWGCAAYRHIPDEQRKKFEPKGELCVFLGLDQGGFRIYRLKDGKVMTSADVRFDETSFPLKKNLDDRRSEPAFAIIEIMSEGHDRTGVTQWGSQMTHLEAPSTPIVTPIEVQAQTPPLQLSDNEVEDDSPWFQSYFDDVRRIMENSEKRVSRRPGSSAVNAMKVGEEPIEPKTFKQAIEGEDAEKWHESIQLEYSALIANKTWDVIDRSLVPNNAAIHRPIWKFKIKEDGRYKSRLCFDGRYQEEGVDFYETYAPVMRLETTRVILNMTLQNGGVIHQMDIPNAFLNADVDTDVYMYEPDGFRSGKVVKLRRSLYGLKQAPHLWFIDLKRVLIGLGYKQCIQDTCAFTKSTGDGKFSFIGIYVDDILLGTNDSVEFNRVFSKLEEEFRVKDLGEMKLFLGMEVEIDKKTNTMKLSQSSKILKLAKMVGVDGLNPTATPYNPSLKLTDERDSPKCDDKMYQSAIGSLWYIARCTRPDVVFIVSLLAQYQRSPSLIHWGAVKHVVRYLMGTPNRGITLGRKGKVDHFVVSVDSSFADVQRGLYSTSGMCCFIGSNPIAWMSKKQSIHAMSSAEAEYNAACDAIKETLWIQELVRELSGFVAFQPLTPMMLVIDSKACMGMIEHGEPGHGRTKHILLRQHFILEKFKEGIFSCHWVPGTINAADLFTKTITSKGQFEKLCEMVMGERDDVGECWNQLSGSK